MTKSPRAGGAIVCLFVGLSACGGGGGGGGGGGNGSSTPPANNYADGLGPSGRVADAIAVSNGLPVYGPVVALDDQGRALVAWSDAGPDRGSPAPTTYYSAASNEAGTWREPVQIAGLPANFMQLGLRANAAGDVIVDSRTTQIARYATSTGWRLIDGLPANGYFGQRSGGLLPDGSLAVATVSPTPEFDRSTVGIAVQSGEDPFVTRYELAPVQSPRAVTVSDLSSGSQGTVVLTYLARTENAPPGMLSIERATLLADGTSAAASTPLLFVPEDTFRNAHFASADAATSTAVLLEDRTQDDNCDLFAARFSAGRDPIVTQLNTESAFGVPAFDSRTQLLMDRRGNALVVWAELRGIEGATTRLMWSRSLAGEGWTSPAPLLPEATGLGVAHSAVVAMNSEGAAIAAVATLQSGRAYLVRSRFAFEAGWTDWARIAENVSTASGDSFDAAINAQGTALIVFRSTPCNDRTLLSAGSARSGCGSPTLYTLRF